MKRKMLTIMINLLYDLEKVTFSSLPSRNRNNIKLTINYPSLYTKGSLISQMRLMRFYIVETFFCDINYYDVEACMANINVRLSVSTVHV